MFTVGPTHRVQSTPLANAAGIHPDIQLKPPVNDPVKALANLCRDNKVTYLGDIHGQHFIPDLVGQSAAELKKAGVDLLAIEFVKFSDNAAFREALAGGKTPTKNFIINAWSKHSDAWVDKVASALCEAHKAGIAVAGIDRHIAGGVPKNSLESIMYMKKRLALNVAWNAATEREERAIGAQKTLVWGGRGHFINSRQDGPNDMRPGPVVGFEATTGAAGCSLTTADDNSHMMIRYPQQAG